MTGAPTYFASWERASDDDMVVAADSVAHDPVVRAMLEIVEGDLLLLDSHRQVLATNQRFLERIGCTDPSDIIGLRPGDCLSCAHEPAAPSGCGTGRACRSCGAVLAIVASQRAGRATSGECLMALGHDGCDAAEFRVRCTPLKVGGQSLTAFVLQDISSEKRRAVLERVFLHDLANSVGSVLGWGELLAMDDVESHDAARQIVALGHRMAREIKGHAALVAAEHGELVVTRERLRPRAVLSELVAALRGVRDGQVTIAVTNGDNDAPFEADPELLARVLGNMLLNAIEASGPGDVVRVWYETRAAGPIFLVNNPGVVPERVRHQIFTRSFTTKGQGRGLGTYGMKLLGERYLGGQVGFRSEPGQGTTFWLALGGAAGGS